jgi:hypothetical protein
MELARQARKHAARETGIALELLEHGVLRHMQQQAVGERLRKHDVGLVEEHQRLAEARPRSDDLDHLFDALRRGEAELHLPVHHDMKADTGIAGAKHGLALADVMHLRAARHPIELDRAHFAEHRQVGEKGLHLDRGLASASLARQTICRVVHGV